MDELVHNQFQFINFLNFKHCNTIKENTIYLIMDNNMNMNHTDHQNPMSNISNTTKNYNSNSHQEH